MIWGKKEKGGEKRKMEEKGDKLKGKEEKGGERRKRQGKGGN